MQLLTGIPAAGGMAIGRVVMPNRSISKVMRQMKDPLQEKRRFDAANLLAKDELLMLKENSADDERDILEFQSALLDDNGYLQEVYSYIDAGAGAAAAVERASSIYEKKMREIGDDYFSERSVDIHDACQRVVDILDDAPRNRIQLKYPSILLGEEITPSDLVAVDRQLLLGIVTTKGSKQGHAAIMARNMGIPAIVRTQISLDQIREGDTIAVDGTTGEVFLYPSDGVRARFTHKMKENLRRKGQLNSQKNKPCISKNGIAVQLLANCSSPTDVTEALTQGAEGIGLLRSEILFMEKGMPDWQTQSALYSECIKAARGAPITIRTADIGADKIVRNFTIADQPNPALGVRGIRLSLLRRDMFRDQIKALLIAALHGPLSVMFPMIATVSDFDEAMSIVDKVRYDLQQEQTPFARDVKFGVMIETPAAALCADALAKRADFFSIGTNDLTQYTHAADRENMLVDSYFLTSSPAVLKLIDMTIRAARAENIPVCICGEAAAQPEIALQYLELSVSSLSMSATQIPELKEYISTKVINLR